MFIFIIFTSILFLLSTLYFFVKYNNNFNKNIYLIEENGNLILKLQTIENEKIELIKNVEKLSTMLHHEKIAREEALNSVKIAMEKSNYEMMERLLQTHKKETEESRKISEKNITKNTEEFNKELQKLQETFVKINKDVKESKTTIDDIQKALLSPTSSGYFAEITLENILKNSGLRTGVDFQMQYSFDSANDSKMRPDAVVFLPEDQIIVIDAKSSQFLLRQTDDDKELLKSIQSHLKSLSSKDYNSEIAKNFSKNNISVSRVITVMFMHTEQAVERISKLDPLIMNKFLEYGIYPAGPVGLMNILNMSKIHISQELRRRNYEDILIEISSIISSIGVLSEHAQKIGSSLSQLVTNYDRFAGSFNRSFLSKMKNISALGISASKKSAIMLKRYDLIPSKGELIDTGDEVYDENDKIENFSKEKITEEAK